MKVEDKTHATMYPSLIARNIAKDIRTVATSFLASLCKEYKHEPDCLIFEYDIIEHRTAGYFFVSRGKASVVVNLAGIRTLRDLYVVLAHEYRHIVQFRTYGLGFYKHPKTLDEYVNHPMEKDADRFSFEVEAGLKYKNRVVNDRVKISNFVCRKQLRSYAP